MAFGGALKHRRYHKEAEAERIYLIRQAHCFYCTTEMNNVPNDRLQKTMDHIQPRAHGGQNILKNYVAACKTCNQDRGNEDFIEYAIKSTLKRRYENVFRVRHPLSS